MNTKRFFHDYAALLEIFPRNSSVVEKTREWLLLRYISTERLSQSIRHSILLDECYLTLIVCFHNDNEFFFHFVRSFVLFPPDLRVQAATHMSVVRRGIVKDVSCDPSKRIRFIVHFPPAFNQMDSILGIFSLRNNLAVTRSCDLFIKELDDSDSN